ncbi:DUF6531 domain-containing protein, partial [Actinophytocola sp.]|uniref:DUF6531 domain-containing protein n=1 Tax=Actinophytocola sp. TaxID=1872138 RepID=UPI00389AA1A4
MITARDPDEAQDRIEQWAEGFAAEARHYQEAGARTEAPRLTATSPGGIVTVTVRVDGGAATATGVAGTALDALTTVLDSLEVDPATRSTGGHSPGLRGSRGLGGSATPSGARRQPPRAKGFGDNPDAHGAPVAEKTRCGGPIDVTTGWLVMPQDDVALAGALPFTVSRTHLSGFRLGRWFGPSWASTLDQRLDV